MLLVDENVIPNKTCELPLDMVGPFLFQLPGNSRLYFDLVPIIYIKGIIRDVENSDVYLID